MEETWSAHDNKTVVFTLVVFEPLTLNVLDVSELERILSCGSELFFDLFTQDVDVLLVNFSEVLDQHNGVKYLDVFELDRVLMPIIFQNMQ